MSSRHPNFARVGLRFAVIGALLCATSLVLPCAHAQQTDAERMEFLESKAKAEKGEAKDQFNLGVCYDKGRGVAKDYTEAVKWYRKAAEQNDAWAQSELGTCYHLGQSVQQDYAEAFAWFSLAAKPEVIAAQNRDDLANWMLPRERAAAKQRAKVLQAQIEAKLKSGGR